MSQNTNNLAAYCWSIADLLRGDFRQSQYGRIILPFTLLRRLEGVLEEIKEAVLAEYVKVQKMKVSEEAQEKLLLRSTKGLPFFNTSKMDLSKLGESGIKDNLESYIQGFSKDAREIFEHFKFAEFIGQLNDANLLYKIVQKVRNTDLSPKAISNHEMGLVFEELIRRFAESSNETAGEHFTPRDIVRLTTSLVFLEDDDALTGEGIIRTIYDPTAGTGGFLSSSMEYVYELNSQAVLKSFGQELNPESYAICKADMLIKGQDVSNIKLGNTLSNDQLYADKFDYMLSNPPFGVDWKKIESEIKSENTIKGFDGRFGPGLPRISDGSLLFLMHLINKFQDVKNGGSRIGVILKGSPLFNGDAGSGESEIRRYLIENDLLEVIVALPDSMFYNTGIQAYILILSNRKNQDRKNKVQIIDSRNIGMCMRKSIGAKRQYFDCESIDQLLKIYAVNEESEHSNIVDGQKFGYRKIKIKLGGNNFDYEKVPLNDDIEAYLTSNLQGVHEKYKIDETYIDDKDLGIGMVGYEFTIDNIGKNKSGKQFRFYFEAVNKSEDWLFCVNTNGRRVIFRYEISDQELRLSDVYFFKIKDPLMFDIDYLKYFFLSKKWKEWLATYNSNAMILRLKIYELLRRFISFPSVNEQRCIVDILEGVRNWRETLQVLESDVWNKSSGSYMLDKYRLPMRKDLQERILEIAPFPLVNIVHHYQNIHEKDYKARYELLLKLFESLAILLSSVLIGYMESRRGGLVTLDFLKDQRRFLKNVSFGTWYKILKKLSEELKGLENGGEHLFIVSILNDNTLKYFERFVAIRNKTSGHGSYPTKSAAKDTLQEVEGLYESFMEVFYDFFEYYTLIRPIQSTWDGTVYTYQVEVFRGLGCYPFGLQEIKTENPFVDGDLYVISDNKDDNIKLFPFIRLIDIEEDSSLEAFYFYSNLVSGIEDDSSNREKEFLFISHQQINRQNQTCTNEQIARIFS